MCVLVLNVGAVVKPSFTKQTPNKYYKINGYYGAVLATAVRVIYKTYAGIISVRPVYAFPLKKISSFIFRYNMSFKISTFLPIKISTSSSQKVHF